MKRGPASRKRLKTAERPISPPKPRRSAATALAARSAGSSSSGTKEERKLGVMQFLCRPATPPPSWKGDPGVGSKFVRRKPADHRMLQCNLNETVTECRLFV